MPKYNVTVTIDETDMQAALTRVYAWIDKHSDSGTPDGVSYISIEEESE